MIPAEFHFIRPYWLLAVIPYIAIVVLLLRNKLSRGNWSAVCDAELLPYLLQEKAVHQSRWPLTTGALAAVLTIIALAGPTWQRLPAPVFRNDSALVIALDLSRSMDAADIKPSRLVMARYKIADMLKQRKDGQTALLVYAGDAFTVTPLTDDTETIDSQLSALTTEIMPSEGSNTVLVLDKAVDLFKQAGLQKGQIVLVTDGADVDLALPSVKALGAYQLSILGVGTADGAPIALPGGGFMKDSQGTIVVPKLNDADLKKLALTGGGVYQKITANDADIQALLAFVNQAHESEGRDAANLMLELWDDKGPWLLLAVLPLAALMFRKGLLGIALLLLLPLPKNSYAFEWRDLWRNQDQQAQQAYQNQQFDQAAKLFENTDWKAAAHYKAGEYDKALESIASTKQEDNPLRAYNEGNALAQSGKLEEAIKAYEKALALKPDDADAKYNKELVEKELEKQKQQQEQQKNEQQQQSKEDSEQDKSKQGDKSDQSGQQQKSEQNSEQSGDEKKPGQEGEQSDEKPEQKPEEKGSDKEQSAESQQQEKQEEQKQAAEKAKPAEPKKTEDKSQSAEPSPADVEQQEEIKQANEQWLKRIPDDPSGLLKRKFKYQYGQREHPSDGSADAW